jgi:nucleoside 2-deoxyribosyltransferase
VRDGARYRVFISHGWADRWLASQIDRRLREQGVDTFIDVTHIGSGDEIEGRIFAEMPKCDEVLALFTPWSVDRNWVWVELGAARALGKRVVAVLYEVSLATIEAEKGGTTFLRSRNVVDINEMEAYFQDVSVRAKRGLDG